MPLDSPESTGVPPPFDVAPAPEPLEPRNPGPPPRGRNGKPPVPAAVFLVFLSAGALVAGAGFVAGFSITRMFGVEPERLSEKPEPAPEPPPAEPEPVEEPPPPRREDPPVLVEPLPRTDHPLDVARGRLESGDVIGARRAATDYLLVRDALSEEDLRRTAQAYALLADSIRAEVERVERSGGRP